MTGGGDIFDTFTAWVAVATVPGWLLAIWWKRRSVERRRQRDIANARSQEAELSKPDGIIEIPPGAKFVYLDFTAGGGGGSNDDR